MHLLPATLTTAQHFISAFSWMLLHSLWIGLLMALVTGAVLALSGNASATKRYNLVLVNFLVLILGCAMAFTWEWGKVAVENISVAATPVTGQQPPAIFGFNFETLKRFADSCLTYFSVNAPTVVLLWFIFFVFRSVKLISGVVYIQRAKRRHIFKAGEEWTVRVGLFCQRLGIRRAVKLLESGFVKMPVVVGSLKPVILIPLGMLSAIPAGQVEAILLHELAHIRRHDFLVNLLQAVAETVFFFNPGLLWMSSLLREERENCCDDIALGQTKNKKEFVQALISFKEHSLYGAKHQVAFPGRKNQLLNRASRIISNKNRGFGMPEKASFTAGLIILMAVLTTAAVTGAESVRKQILTTVKNVVAHTDTRQRINVNTTHTIAKAAIHFAPPSRRRILSTKSDSLPVSANDSLKLASDRVNVISEQATAVQASADKALRPAEKALPVDKIPLSPEAEQGRRDKEQGLRNEEDAKRDKAQAIVDEVQAKKDQAQAIKDREQALRDKQQAKKDVQSEAAAVQNHDEVSARQMKLNELQDMKNLQQDAKNAEQAQRNEEQSRLNKIQEAKNEEQAIKNEEQARLNKIQENKNDEQAKRNEQQARLNEEQLKKDQAQAAANGKQAVKNQVQAAVNVEKDRLNKGKQKQSNNQAEQNKVSVQ